MVVPQPFQYQGSKRALAPLILNYLPAKYRRLVDPFAGSAAMTLACAARGRAERYWINDLNKPLAELLNLMINRPEELADAYAELWKGEAEDALENYFCIFWHAASKGPSATIRTHYPTSISPKR